MTFCKFYVFLFLLLQDTLVLLDLIGTEETQFANWFSKTLPLYKTFRKIGTNMFLAHQ